MMFKENGFIQRIEIKKERFIRNRNLKNKG